MYWLNFLHFYQPPHQKPYWVKRVAQESYCKIIQGLKKNPQAKITLNINAILVELFERDGLKSLIYDIRRLAERGQIEFTETAKYHPFLPLLPRSEIERQIKLNYQTNRKFFGKAYQPEGFFPTEMGYSKKVGQVAKKLGYKWIILDELAYKGRTKSLSADTIYTLKGAADLNVFFRDRETSFRILSTEAFSANILKNILGDRLNKKEYLVTAMDGETFGHHRPGLEDFLFDIYKIKGLESIFFSDLPELFSKREVVEPRDSSWALMMRDIENNTPFSRWYSADNEIHVMQWKLTNLAIREVNKLNKKSAVYKKARPALDRSLHSDQYWWASAQPWWSMEMMETGAKELKDVVLMLPGRANIKKQAEKLYQDIVFTGFAWQKTDKIERLSREADEDVTQRITRDMQVIPLEEYNNITRNLRRLKQKAVENEEYERAAQIRDRIRELEEKKDDITK